MPTPVTAGSFYDLVELSDVRLSPDGTQAAFVRTHIDRVKQTYHRAIWLRALNGDAPSTPLTFSGKDSAPRWRPDGSWLGFLSGRADKPAVYALPMRVGEALSGRHPREWGGWVRVVARWHAPGLERRGARG